MPVRLLQQYRAITPREPQQITVTDPQVRDPAVSSPFLSTSPFGRTDVWPSVSGATVVTWEQNKNFKEPIPEDSVIVLEFSYTPQFSDSWQQVSEQPLTYYLEDRVNRWRSQSIYGGYRLRIVCSDAAEFESEPVELYSKLSFTEYRTVLRILRAENRQVYHKSAGYLLKRRWLGVRCTRCNNPLINNAEQEQCPICYATGFVGGYFKPVPCALEFRPAGSNDTVDNSRGPVNDGNSDGRLTALYAPDMNDVWVDSSTGTRWRIQGHDVVASCRSLPVVLQCSLKSIPASDIVYSFDKDL